MAFEGRDMKIFMLFWAFDTTKSTLEIKQKFPKLIEKCQRKEKEKIKKYYHDRDRNASLIGQLMIQKGIQVLFDTLGPVEIHRNDQDRPFVKQFNCDFNLSHHGDYVVFAISKQNRIGIDITKIGNNPLNAFTSIFSEREWYWIYAHEDHQKRFSCLWALKESYVKYTGEGITVDLSLISFTLELVDISDYYSCIVWKERYDIVLHVKGVRVDLFFRVEMIDEDHILAQCVSTKEPASLQFLSLSFLE
jgi:phosphopantetheinyl transferase